MCPYLEDIKKLFEEDPVSLSIEIIIKSRKLQGDSFRCVTFENVGTQIILSFWDYSDNFYSIWVVNN